MTELEEIRAFTETKHISEHIAEMEKALDLCNGYESRIGFLANEAEYAYERAHTTALDEILVLEEMTEVQRGALLKSKLADKKKTLSDLKVMKAALRNIRMSLMQSIKTRREEPH